MHRNAALITGASAGIGRAYAIEAVRRGWQTMLLTARRVERLEELAALLRAQGAGAVHCLPADLSNPAERRQLLAAVERLGIVPDLIVNNAGFGSLGPFSEADPSWELKMVAVNVEAPVEITRH
ncbi:MAG: SDR family NAD(P)-dependent oxidoreductase, partial [Bdellovibrionales bacterium]|nr:SDR family NAD(P)-dependent oxidoreductase [Bdellovibrionales bacterium]